MFTSRILISFIYFATGFLIPVLSRFLMKLYPCSMHSYFGDMLKLCFNKFNKQKYNKVSLNNNRFKSLKIQYLYTRITWGALYLILFTLLEFFILNYISESYHLTLLFIFIFLLGFSANIDARCHLIPDIITFPMLMIGFLIAVQSKELGVSSTLNISIINSIYSSIGAYILCFTLALIFYFKVPYAFGGGDVKLLTALASFVGFENLGFILVISFIIMLGYCVIKKARFAPLAPFIFSAFLVWIFKVIIEQVLI